MEAIEGLSDSYRRAAGGKERKGREDKEI